MINANFLDIKKDITILFNSVRADNSRYVYQKNVKEYPGKVAVMAEFLPSFKKDIVTADKIEYTNDPFDL